MGLPIRSASSRPTTVIDAEALGRVFKKFVDSASEDLCLKKAKWKRQPDFIFSQDEGYCVLEAKVFNSLFVHRRDVDPDNLWFVRSLHEVKRSSNVDSVVLIASGGLSERSKQLFRQLNIKFLDVPEVASKFSPGNLERALYKLLMRAFRDDPLFEDVRKRVEHVRPQGKPVLNFYYQPDQIPYYAPRVADKDTLLRHGLSTDEYERILSILGCEPKFTELGIFSVMWSEHCSYKSSRVWLKTLPTTGPQVIQGPGENAGVVDLGDGQAAVFKMESHNHPSYIEPYQGAATGVGGIMRDVFTMGARPIANMNALRFGAPDHPKTRHLVSGVVSGIGDYGNCMGVPTVGGETNFDAGYNDNILVNAMCVGLVDNNRIFKSAAKGVGLPVVYVGSKTGRDGIHGATMASTEFDEASKEKRPTVQVGDPFTEKLLLEACLELMQEDAIVAIQDMGAAGLTSSSVEMADKGGVGIELDLDRVPTREEAMTAYEMLLSESQERMLMVLKPGAEKIAGRVFKKWQLDFAVIGTTTDTSRIVVRHRGAVEADIPLSALAHAAPLYERPWTLKPPPALIAPGDVPAPASLTATLEAMMASPHLSSRRWIWEQYDHMVMGDTVQRPGGDAAVLRVHGTHKGLAMSCDVTPRYCAADPREGAKQAVAECWRNLTAVGAKPLAITDCLNFGSPERPEIMGEFVGAVEGMAEACTALAFPVVSGNVSLYNETNGVAIPPTPAIGGVGLISDIAAMATIALKNEGDELLLFGAERGHLGQSLYQKLATGNTEGAPPPVDLDAERRTGDLVRELIGNGKVSAVHDVSDGGLLAAIAEMALAGGLGAELEAAPDQLPVHAIWFGEDQGRYVVAVAPGKADAIRREATSANVPVRLLGRAAGDALTLSGEAPLSLHALREAHRTWLPRFMAGG